MAALSAGALAVAALLGAFPTFRVAGPAGLTAMGLGCGIALLAAIAGVIPPLMIYSEPTRRPVGLLLGTAFRSLVLLVLLLAAIFSGLVPTVPLVVWAGIAYAILLIVDTTALVRFEKRAAEARA
jgi:hypothetical protein